MSKFLKFLGGIFLILLVVGGIATAIFVRKGLALEKDAVAYWETNLPLIVASWNSEDLAKRAAPEFLVPSVQQQLPKVFAFLSPLGKLKRLGKPTGEVTLADFQVSLGDSHFTLANFRGTPIRKIWAAYAADAEFEAGPARVDMVLVRNGNSWQVMGFHVNSPALVRPPG